MKQNRIYLQHGFSMVELIISISILSLGLLVVYQAFFGFIMTANATSQKFTAAYLAQEGMEIVRNIRDNNFVNKKSWDQNLQPCNSGCQLDYKTQTPAEQLANQVHAYDGSQFLNVNTDGFYSYDIGTPTIFQRKIITQKEDPNTMKVIVQIFWKYNGKSYSFQTEGYLYNWY